MAAELALEKILGFFGLEDQKVCQVLHTERRSYLEDAERKGRGIKQDVESKLDPLLLFSPYNVQNIIGFLALQEIKASLWTRRPEGMSGPASGPSDLGGGAEGHHAVHLKL